MIYSSFVKMLNFFVLLKSCIYYCFAMLVTVNRHADREMVMVGSNYGGKPDPSVSCLRKAAIVANLPLYFITNGRNGDCQRGSLQSFVQYFMCEKVYYTHSLSDILPNMHRASLLINLGRRPRLIFLQHGVIGLKKYSPRGSIDKYINSLERTFDLICASTDFEKNILISMGLPLEKIHASALPRFDRLEYCADLRKVLVFLTWNNPLEYQAKLDDILQVLSDFEHKGVEYLVFNHEMMGLEYYGYNPVSDSMQNVALHAAINDSSLLITDESSIAWDYFYKGNEVILYRPFEPFVQILSIIGNRVANSKKELNEKIIKHLEGGKQDQFREFVFFDHGTKLHSKKALLINVV